jgi:AraC-like DNA-binding protein
MVTTFNRPLRIATVAAQVNTHKPLDHNRFQMNMNCCCADSHPDQTQSQAAQIIGPAINHMLQNLNQPLRISTLSTLAGVSVSQFFLLFKSVTGCSPINFFIRLRMRRACDLLGYENLRVKETAALLGYDDAFYFSRVFKSVIGIAPSSYRQVILESPRAESNCLGVFSRGRTHNSLNLPMAVIANVTL